LKTAARSFFGHASGVLFARQEPQKFTRFQSCPDRTLCQNEQKLFASFFKKSSFFLVPHRPSAAPLYETIAAAPFFVQWSGRRQRGRVSYGVEEPVF
jgi:hypothetical protein